MAILNTMTLVGLWRFIEKQVRKGKRSPFEYVVLATIAVLVGAILKYPNRAIFTRSRPDLKDKTASALPIVGNMAQMLRNSSDSLGSMDKAFKHFGTYFSLSVPIFGRMIAVNTPEHYEHIMKTNFNNYIKGRLLRENLEDILGGGIFVADQDAWRFHRKTAANIFTTKLYRQLVEGAFHDSGLDLCSVLDRYRVTNKPIDLQANFLKLTLDAFGKLTFGLEFEALKNDGPNEFGDAFDYLTTMVDGRVSNPFWFITDKLVPGKVRKIKEAIGTLDKFAAQAVKKRREETEEEKEARPRDLLDHFINHVADDGTMLTDVELRDVFVNFMIAGRDTTAQALTWQFFSLMSNPRVMHNLVREIDIVLQGNRTYTYEVMMQDLPYLKAVFHETLRLYPPVPKNFKQAVDHDVLPGGTRVYPGDMIAISPWCMARNQDVWGVDAELFVPERWLDTSVEPSTRENASPFGKFRVESPFKFPTFNAGPRLCLGQTFATLEAFVTTCMLLQRFNFKFAPGHHGPEYKGSVTLPMAFPLLAILTVRD
ncbi:hypothetical protein EMPS_00972 [Entomortierella parvispora]|uniref:Cytochrome P450 n=1 Tax=Entomortierella parvispora TaxID=205924 RepID=A0A9P3H1Z1_9FUNG|nr:hypothetical protein EMPS_00972 [Entomortierella parvispora]